MSILVKILDLIESNRISSTEVSDVLGKTGQIEGVYALNPGMYRVGEAKMVYAINNSNYEVHKQLAEIDDLRGKILFVYNVNCDRAVFGNLVSKYILFYKRAEAIVINGKLRDIHTLIKEKYPIWLQGVSPIGCVNCHNGPDIDSTLLQEIRDRYDGSIMVCDDSGVVMIPKDEINEQLITKLEFIEFQEDVWRYCVDTLKMSTYDTICLKKYLEGDLIDNELLEKLNKFQQTMNQTAL